MAMKPGNLSQTAWRRSVGKQFHDQKPGRVSGLTREGRYSSLAMPAGGYAVWADAVKEGGFGRTAYYAVLEAAGNAAAAGAVPSAVSAQILLPPGAEEEELRELAAGIRAACGEMHRRRPASRGRSPMRCAGAQSQSLLWAVQSA